MRTVPCTLYWCAFSAGLLAFLFWFAGGAFGAYFAPDDMMNLYGYWARGWASNLKANVLFFSTAYRPFGAFYYYSLYSLFGMELAPYRVTAIVLVLVNVWLLFRLAREWSESTYIAAAAVALVAAHPALCLIYYSNSVIYDILTYTFYLAALTYYLRVRRGGELRWFQTGVVCCGYIAAINSKEMGVTLPFLIGLYEALRWRTARWRPVVILFVIAAVFIAGKRFGPDSLFDMDGYRTEWTVRRYLETSSMELGQLFHGKVPLPQWVPVVLYGGMLGIAAALRSPRLWWAAALAIAAFLPVNFLQPRESFVCYLPLAGWGLYVAGLLSRVALRLRIPQIWLPPIALALAIAVNVPGREKMELPMGAMERTWFTLQALRAAPLHPRSGECVLLDNDPFDPFWDLYFIGKLHFGDPSIRVAFTKAEGEKPRGDDCTGGIRYQVTLDGPRIAAIRSFDPSAMPEKSGVNLDYAKTPVHFTPSGIIDVCSRHDRLDQ